eukprot:TRINITY_DN66108_c0_g1_i1.p1 TRINITY_DN66108_c0_g1~~TRINITY_DN66108_c0_g1_i1.p1  ORF type:complete len:470 (+),score=56.79 TRINITY_DN66108_c0_g1_i1:26-1411(+)
MAEERETEEGVTSRFLLPDLPEDLDEETIRHYFSVFGDIEDVNIKELGGAGPNSGKRMGSVKFRNPNFELKEMMLNEAHEINGFDVSVTTWRLQKMQRSNYHEKLAEKRAADRAAKGKAKGASSPRADAHARPAASSKGKGGRDYGGYGSSEMHGKGCRGDSAAGYRGDYGGCGEYGGCKGCGGWGAGDWGEFGGPMMGKGEIQWAGGYGAMKGGKFDFHDARSSPYGDGAWGMPSKGGPCGAYGDGAWGMAKGGPGGPYGDGAWGMASKGSPMGPYGDAAWGKGCKGGSYDGDARGMAFHGGRSSLYGDEYWGKGKGCGKWDGDERSEGWGPVRDSGGGPRVNSKGASGKAYGKSGKKGDDDFDITARFLLSDLSDGTTENDIRDYFAAFGDLEDVQCRTVEKTGELVGSIKFSSPTVQLRQTMLKKPHYINDQRVKVETWKMKKLAKPYAAKGDGKNGY